jgi:hypothetical protein
MTYRELLAAAQADPASADFHALRMAYVHSDEYNPYQHDAEHVQALNEALHHGEKQAALDAINRLLDYHYLDIEAHMAADYVNLLLDHPQESAYHRAWATGLIRAILSTGDGRGYDTAIIVLSVPEEYTVLRVMGYTPTGQQLVQQDGHWFDILEGRAAEAAQTTPIYFNIDLPHTWLDTHVGEGGA